jgi:hypothetical protein
VGVADAAAFWRRNLWRPEQRSKISATGKYADLSQNLVTFHLPLRSSLFILIDYVRSSKGYH